MFRELSSRHIMSGGVSRRAAAFLSGLLTVFALSIAVAGPLPPETSGQRQSTSQQFATDGRTQSSPTTVTKDRFEALITEGERDKPGARRQSSKSASSAEAPRNDFWIYFADVVLFGDDDQDGFAYGIDLLFDADTIYEVADVYAVLYLSLDGGPWNEYAVTEDFSIFGATSDDEYVVVTELESGYPSGSYDLLIELYDAIDGAFLTSLGPADTSELGFLPLEDFNLDDPHFDVPISHSHSGGGAMGVVTLAVLLLFGVAPGQVRRRHNGSTAAL